MSKTRKIPTKHTPEFRDDAVSIVRNPGESAAKRAPKLGVNETTLATQVSAYRNEVPSRPSDWIFEKMQEFKGLNEGYL